MSDQNSKVKAVFGKALEIESREAQAAYLDEACGDDTQLRREVQDLLRAIDQAGSFMARPVMEPQATLDQPIPEKPGTQIGPYKLLQEIGQGGMGVVYMAEQEQPVRRRVALKIIKPGMDTRQVVARFEAERQALSLMDHPNIAKVLDAGTTDSGRPYFVMELVKGQPITQYCDEHHLTPRQRLELLLPVCHAIQHAHQKGVIHRDIKPTNILVAEYDSQPVPKVIDFGVAKATSQALTEKTMFTGFGQIVGTLEYMSPEQAKVNQLDIDTRSDIYSLGVLLYELLTGSLPFDKKRLRSAAWDEMLRIIREEEPEKPSTRLSSVGSAHGHSESGDAVGTAHPTLASIAAVRGTEPARLTKLVRGELDWIVMKALEKDRNRRYETANGFAADVQRYLADEPVEAGPPSTVYRLRKLAHRHRVVVLVAVSLLLVLTAGIVVSTWQAVRATNAQRRYENQRDAAVASEQRALGSEQLAQQRQKEALDASDELRDTLYAAELTLVQAAWESDNLPRMHELLNAQLPKEGQRDLRGFEWHYWDRLCHAEAGLLQLPHTFPETPWSHPTFARAGARLAALVPRNGIHELQVWDATTGNKLRTIPLPDVSKRTVYHAISADGERIATISTDNRTKAAPFDLRLHDANTGKEIAAITVPGLGSEQSAMLSLNADGSRILTIVASVERPTFEPTTAAATSQLIVWNVATSKALLTVALGSVRPGPALSPDGSRVAAIVSQDGKGDVRSPHVVKTWDVASGQQLQSYAGSSGEPFMQVVFSPDGKRLAASGMALGADGIWIWDAAGGKELRAIGGRRAAGLLSFSPDGKYLATYNRHGTSVTLWDVATGKPWSIFKGHATGVLSVAFDEAGRCLRTVTLDGTIRAWNIPDIERSRGISISGIRMAFMAISPDGGRSANLPLFGAESNQIEVLDPSGNPVSTMPLPSGIAPTIHHLAFNRSGTRLAMSWRANGPTGETFNVRVWDTSNGIELLNRSDNGRLSFVCPALSSNGNTVSVPFATGAPSAFGYHRFGGVKLIEVMTGQVVRTLELNPPPDVCLTEFSPDGKRLAIASVRTANADPSSNQVESTGQVWDMASGKEPVLLMSETWQGFPSAVTFSPDGSLLAVARLLHGVGPGQAVMDVLETATGRSRCTLRGHAARVITIAFSPDGRRIASGAIDPASGDSEIRLWDTASGKGLSTFTCHGGISGLAFRADGHQLIAVRKMSPDTERGAHVWDATPRPERLAPPGDTR